jgi:aromatic ring hydroxylase
MTSSLSKATENLRAIMGECTRPEINTETIRAEAEARARVGVQAQQELTSQAQQRTYDSLAQCSSAMMRMDVLLGKLKKAQQTPGQSRDALSATREMLRMLARHFDTCADQSLDVDDIHASLGEAACAIESIIAQIEDGNK